MNVDVSSFTYPPKETKNSLSAQTYLTSDNSDFQRKFYEQYVSIKHETAKRRYSSDKQSYSTVQLRRQTSRHGNKRGKIVLPRKFMLGGSITDPLNLNSLCDEAVNRALNERTPVSSPIPLPTYKEIVDVRIPSDTDDPLRLNTVDNNVVVVKPGRRKRKRKNLQSRRRSRAKVTTADSHVDLVTQCGEDKTSELIEASHRRSRRYSIRRKRRHTICECGPSGQHPKNKTVTGNRYLHGNRNNYWTSTSDERLSCLPDGIFRHRRVLDIGCNSGVLTTLIAHRYEPQYIRGIDEDTQLIRQARQNLDHYLSDLDEGPRCFNRLYGDCTLVPLHPTPERFPGNIQFITGNYMFCDDNNKYDVVVALLITKWIQLRYGDDGIMTFFRKVYNQLDNNGVFILQSHRWRQYHKVKRLSFTYQKTFSELKFHPEHFADLLVSDVIGFSSYRRFYVESSGQARPRPLYVFYKHSNISAATKSVVKQLTDSFVCTK